MLHVHHADPGDDDPLTWDEVHGEQPILLPSEVRDRVDVLETENAALRSRLTALRTELVLMQVRLHIMQSILSEGA